MKQFHINSILKINSEINFLKPEFVEEEIAQASAVMIKNSCSVCNQLYLKSFSPIIIFLLCFSNLMLNDQLIDMSPPSLFVIIKEKNSVHFIVSKVIFKV